MIAHKPTDLYQDNGVNYHYLLVDVTPLRIQVTMNKLEIESGKEKWTQPDNVIVSAKAPLGNAQAATKP